MLSITRVLTGSIAKTPPLYFFLESREVCVRGEGRWRKEKREVERGERAMVKEKKSELVLPSRQSTSWEDLPSRVQCKYCYFARPHKRRQGDGWWGGEGEMMAQTTTQLSQKVARTMAASTRPSTPGVASNARLATDRQNSGDSRRQGPIPKLFILTAWMFSSVWTSGSEIGARTGFNGIHVPWKELI